MFRLRSAKEKRHRLRLEAMPFGFPLNHFEGMASFIFVYWLITRSGYPPGGWYLFSCQQVLPDLLLDELTFLPGIRLGSREGLSGGWLIVLTRRCFCGPSRGSMVVMALRAEGDLGGVEQA